MRIACGLAYDGTHYAGWQWQTNLPTIQAKIEAAISQLAMHPVRIMGAGRTDSGVHASYQVIHFDTPCERTQATWKAGINYYLPKDIRLLWIQPVDATFHARFSALKRSYRYIIYQGDLPWFRQYSWNITDSLAIEAIQTAACDLIGEHDFSAFRAAQCQSASPVREIFDITVRQQGDHITVDISANAFLHHMVRNIMGILVAIGRKKRPIDAIQHVLASRDRRQAERTAPPQGLYLKEIHYPALFQIPPATSFESIS